MAKQPYTAAQRDKLLDQLLADVAELKERLDHQQETDTAEMDQQQVVVRPAVERVRRRDGKIVRRVVRPR